ncbi:MAG: hypothetical protein IKA01_07885 [Alistipes sp.]|nr:hypothetical protein [Alistipes sp.]
MKFLKKIAYMLTLIGLVFGLGACTEEVEYEPAAKVEGAQVYFANTNATNINADIETTQIDVVVMRGNTEGAITVPIKAIVSVPATEDEDTAEDSVDPASLFTIPSNISFGDGKDTAKLTIALDRENLEDGQTYTIALTLNDASVVTPYGDSKLSISVVVPQPMKLLGVGHYCDDLIYPWFFGGTVTYEVEIYENLKKPGYIAMKNPYTVAYKEYLINDFGLAESAWDAFVESLGGDTYIYINIEDPTQVTVAGQNVGLDVGFGEMMMGTNQGTYGTLENKIISFPENSLLVIDNEGYNFTTGLAKIWLPGAVMTDFSLELAYGGFRVAEDNETIYPIARAAYGEDVAEIQYAFVAGDITTDVDALTAALAGIEDDSVVSNKVAVTIAGEDEETGEPILEMNLESVEGAEPGVFTVIAIPYSAEGEAQYEDLAFTSFYVQGVGATEAPEVDLELEWMPFSEAMPDYAAEYPDHSTWCCIMYGSEIKAMKYFLNTTGMVDTYLSLGLTEQDMIDQAGSDFDPSDINENGVGIFYVKGVPADTSFTLVVWAENNYGKTVIKTASGATAPEPSAKKGNAKLSWDRINGKQIAFNPNKAMSITTIQ